MRDDPRRRKVNIELVCSLMTVSLRDDRTSKGLDSSVEIGEAGASKDDCCSI